MKKDNKTVQILIKEVFKRKPALETMKKLTLLICTLFLFACSEKKFDNVIDPKPVEYQFINLTVPENVDYSTNPTVIPKIEIRNLPSGSEVWFDVSSLYSNELLNTKVVMKDDGLVQTSGDPTANDNIYSGKFTFDAADFTGRYELSFFVKSPDSEGGETERKIALKTFQFNGAHINEPPVISNLSMPDSVATDIEFLITLKVSDINGPTDILDVYFRLTDPSGYQYDQLFYLYDDGSSAVVDVSTNKTSGDTTAGDGTFTRRLSFRSTTPKGDWNFEFRAKDQSNITGNIITHKLKLK